MLSTFYHHKYLLPEQTSDLLWTIIQFHWPVYQTGDLVVSFIHFHWSVQLLKFTQLLWLFQILFYSSAEWLSQVIQDCHYQGRIQDFKLGGALKILGYFRPWLPHLILKFTPCFLHIFKLILILYFFPFLLPFSHHNSMT